MEPSALTPAAHTRIKARVAAFINVFTADRLSVRRRQISGEQLSVTVTDFLLHNYRKV